MSNPSYSELRRIYHRSALGTGLIYGIATIMQTLNVGLGVLGVLVLFGVSLAVLMDWSLDAIVNPFIDNLINSKLGQGLTLALAYPIAYGLHWLLLLVEFCFYSGVIISVLSAGTLIAYDVCLNPLAFAPPPQFYKRATPQWQPLPLLPARAWDIFYGAKHGAYGLHPITQILLLPHPPPVNSTFYLSY